MVTERQSKLSENKIVNLFSIFGAAQQDQENVSVSEGRNIDKNMRYANDILFGTVSHERLRQVRMLETVYGPTTFNASPTTVAIAAWTVRSVYSEVLQKKKWTP